MRFHSLHLYLGAASGTTASHVADIVDWLVCVCLCVCVCVCVRAKSQYRTALYPRIVDTYLATTYKVAEVWQLFPAWWHNNEVGNTINVICDRICEKGSSTHIHFKGWQLSVQVHYNTNLKLSPCIALSWNSLL